MVPVLTHPSSFSSFVHFGDSVSTHILSHHHALHRLRVARHVEARLSECILWLGDGVRIGQIRHYVVRRSNTWPILPNHMIHHVVHHMTVEYPIARIVRHEL